MKKHINNIYFMLIPLILISISMNILPFWIILILLIIRLIYTDRHSIGIILILYGGILASAIRFNIPSIPIYGIIINLIGLFLIKDQIKNIKNNSSSIYLLIIILIYFFYAYILSPNIDDNRAQIKINSIIYYGIISFFAFYTLTNSNRINNESITQNLFLIAILFIIHDMNLLGISPKSIFDYEWLRTDSRILFNSTHKHLFQYFINYQIIGIYSLFAICIYLSQLKKNTYKTYIYILTSLQLVLISCSRQAIFGLCITIILYYTVFNIKNLQGFKFSRKLKTLLISAIFAYLLVQILLLFNIEYITKTFSEGDEGRNILYIMGWELFLEHPLLGTGIGGFNHNYPGMLFPHNIIIEILCECGIIGIIYLISILIIHLKKQKIKILYITQNKSFIFLIITPIIIRTMISDDLSYSISLFSAILACNLRKNI